MTRAASKSLVSIAILSYALSAAGDEGVTASKSSEGERIYQSECSKCHGAAGQGGKAGEYPRLAGLPEGYIAAQLRAFRDRIRRNKPMIPVLKAGRLHDRGLEAVAAYLTNLPIPTANEVEVPPAPKGNLELGKGLYVTDCALCHGHDGEGKEDTDNPPVVRQYPSYLIKQMVDFRNGKRWHEYGKQLFGEAAPDELDAMLSYMLHLNHKPPVR